MRWTMAAGALALAGCATGGTPAPEMAAAGGEPIRYETSPCFGACPVYTVTIRPDESGTFEGRRFTAVEGARAFTGAPGTYRRYAAALAPYRPAGERLIQPGTTDCGNAPTDMPGIDVRWGGASHLSFYTGCAAEHDAMAKALRSVPDMLPIGDFIGPRAPFAGQR